MKPSALRTLTLYITGSFKELLQFVESTNFSRAFLVGIAVTLPIVAGLLLGYLEAGLALCFGAFWSSPSDVSGSFRHKNIGILISAALAMVVSFIGGYLHYEAWLTLPVLGVLSFGIAFISVYGFRASLISFSGLLALVLSFAFDPEALEIYQYALLVGLGGLWYLLLTKIWHHINPKAETEEFLSLTYVLTADFIKTRGKLIDPHEDREKLQSKLQQLQSDLTENHKTLREILILSRRTSGWSNYQDKRLLVFVQLIEMMETAIANPVNYDRMDRLFHDHPQSLIVFQQLIFKMAHQLQVISEVGNNKKGLPKNDSLRQCFKAVNLEITKLGKTLGNEEYLMLQNFLEYQEKQFKKLKRIKWLLGNPSTAEIDFIDRKAAKRFLVTQDYDPVLLWRNFSFKSTIFRHSLRLAVTIMIGYALGSIFPFQNPYWILLTIIVIMRPSYGLTKSRAKDRMNGTLIGGVIATALVFLIREPIIYGAMGIVSLIFALSLVQKNYKASAAFVTLSVIFIFAILEPDVLSVIKFRVLDTLVGAGLSYVAMLWLWPTWEFVEINESIAKSVKANANFLHKIATYYQQKGKIPTSYHIARKQAFLETSNLNSAFQRMAQEPKSKQNAMDTHYELVVLNHNFLASLASISTYIQHHKTSEASETFTIVIGKIEQNMALVLQCLHDNECKNAEQFLVKKPLFDDQLPPYYSLEITNLASKDKETIRDLQEAHLVWEQLQWLFSLSRKMLQLAVALKRD
ncbi:FUSC family protein [Cellulophaga sp. F20128]|uniref:FUSC family protein n=1 Tax=Cellulophaga sp. F20128 TaxID=2926413 RepID=UPI001FF3EB8A|nr:FUSC family membrane protein [Cellulophaga sp. F20128]MCK0157270.1 FUSC family protein [Cellulophaga sp. F20128]